MVPSARFSVLGISLALGLPFLLTIPAPAADMPAPLFREAPLPSGSMSAKVASNDFGRREGYVDVDWRNLVPPGLDAPDAVARRLLLNLLPDARFTAERTRLTWYNANRFNWVGRIGEGEVILAVQDGAMHGSIHVGGRVFEIESVSGGRHRVTELDPHRFLENERAHPDACEDPEGEGQDGAPAQEGDAGPVDGAAISPAAADPVIDVMVLYDKGVADRGGVDAFLAALIEQSNQSYRISAIPQTIRLVHSRQVTSGVIGNHNTWIRTNADVARWREQYGADLVAMIVESGLEPCGIAVTGGYVSTIRRSCALGDRSFTHELGHNMGAKHAREQYETLSGYAYGYINHKKSWRTVMSYSVCNQGGPCTRLGNFSNPDVLHDGDPTGIADSSDNARMVRLYSQTISGYMPTRVGVLSGAPQPRVIANAPDGFEIRGIGKGTLSLRLTRAEHLEISRRDLTGRNSIVAEGNFQPGDHTLAWRQGDLPAGVHFIRIRGGDRAVFRKIPVMN